MPKLITDLPDIFTLLQGIIAVLLIGVWAALLLLGRTVPQEVNTLVALVVGYFFGGVSIKAITRLKAQAATGREVE